MDTHKKYLLTAAALIVAIVFYFQHQKEQSTASLHQEVRRETAALAKVEAPPQKAELASTGTTSPQEAKDPELMATKSSVGEVSEEERQRIYSEVKTSLSSMYTAEKAFFAEYNRYSSDLKAIGWEPSPGEMNVKVGFADTGVVANLTEGEEPDTRMDSDFYVDQSTPDISYGYSKWAEGLSLKNLSGHCRNGCRASENRFEIMAVSRTGPKGEPEVWVINDDKEIIKVEEKVESR